MSKRAAESSATTFRLPLQLGAIVKQEGELMALDDDAVASAHPDLDILDAASSTANNNASSNSSAPLACNQIVAAAQQRNVKELSSYVRVVCMRLGFEPHPAATTSPVL